MAGSAAMCLPFVAFQASLLRFQKVELSRWRNKDVRATLNVPRNRLPLGRVWFNG